MIGKYFNENRTPVKYEEVNPDFWKALIDTEDERFYKHFGIDPISLVGALKDAVLHQDARGASTITQPLQDENAILYGIAWQRSWIEDAHHENKGMDCSHQTGNNFRQERDSYDVCQHR